MTNEEREAWTLERTRCAQYREAQAAEESARAALLDWRRESTDAEAAE